MPDANTIYTVIGVTVVATSAGAFGREIISKLFLKRNGNGNNGNGSKPKAMQPCGLHENVIKRMDERDEKYSTILAEQHTMQKLIMQRMDQTDEGLKLGRNHFSKLFDTDQVHTTKLALHEQRIDRLER